MFGPISAIFESAGVAARYVEVMLAAEGGTEAFIRNPVAAASVLVVPAGLLLVRR
jgi:hypothetical protein